MDARKFVKRIELCCKELGTTRTAWAKSIGFPEATIRNWLRKGSMPSVETVYDFSKRFGVPMEYMLNCPEAKIDDNDMIILLKMKKLSAKQKKVILGIADNFIKENESKKS